jgi:hypothetical protein
LSVPTLPPEVTRITSFFQRLGDLGPLLKRITGVPMEMVIAIRDTDVRISLDLRADPVTIRVGGAEIAGDIVLAATNEDLHRVLTGQASVVDGIMSRTLLLSGGMSFLVRGFRVMELAPLLYADHLHRSGRRGLRTRTVEPQARAVAYGIGRSLALRPETELIEAIDALAVAVMDHSPYAHPRAPIRRVAQPDNPLETPAPSDDERRRRARTCHSMTAAGKMVGLAKYRAGADVDLFRVVGRLSDGLAAGAGA